jgi:hypothetical protein
MLNFALQDCKFSQSYDVHFEGAAGAAVAAGAAWNSFIDPNSVLYTPQPKGMPTSSHASKIIPADDFFATSVISIPPGLDSSRY